MHTCLVYHLISSHVYTVSVKALTRTASTNMGMEDEAQMASTDQGVEQRVFSSCKNARCFFHAIKVDLSIITKTYNQPQWLGFIYNN